MFSIIVLFLGWNFAGGFGAEMIADSIVLRWNVMNPYYVYQHAKVNWFGAIMISLLCAVLCPIWALCYWFYFLCTIGRKD